MDTSTKLAESQEIAGKVSPLLRKRLDTAAADCTKRVEVADMRCAEFKDYADLMPSMPPDQWRRIRGEQDIIVRHEPERALETLSQLLDDEQRKRLLALPERAVSDKRVLERKPTAQQVSMLGRVRKALASQRERG